MFRNELPTEDIQPHPPRSRAALLASRIFRRTRLPAAIILLARGNSRRLGESKQLLPRGGSTLPSSRLGNRAGGSNGPAIIVLGVTLGSDKPFLSLSGS